MEETFDSLVEAEGQGLFRFLYWALGREADARDALQETLMRIHRGLPGFRGETTLHHWAFRIATNVARDLRGRRGRAPKTYGLEAAENASVVHRSEEVAPDGAVVASETSALLERGLAELPPELREPLLLHTMSGMKYREIAEALGIPIATVSTRIHAARMKLQALLGDL